MRSPTDGHVQIIISKRERSPVMGQTKPDKSQYEVAVIGYHYSDPVRWIPAFIANHLPTFHFPYLLLARNHLWNNSHLLRSMW